MGFLVAEWNTSQFAGLCKHRVAIGQAGKGCCVKRGEGVERIPVYFCPLSRCKYEIVIEGRIVAYQYRTLAIMRLDRLAYGPKNLAQPFTLGHSLPVRIPGVDSCEVQCRLFQIGTLKRINLL